MAEDSGRRAPLEGGAAIEVEIQVVAAQVNVAHDHRVCRVAENSTEPLDVAAIPKVHRCECMPELVGMDAETSNSPHSVPGPLRRSLAVLETGRETQGVASIKASFGPLGLYNGFGFVQRFRRFWSHLEPRSDLSRGLTRPPRFRS